MTVPNYGEGEAINKRRKVNLKFICSLKSTGFAVGCLFTANNIAGSALYVSEFKWCSNLGAKFKPKTFSSHFEISKKKK